MRVGCIDLVKDVFNHNKTLEEIFDPIGSNISQVGRYIKKRHINNMNKIEYNKRYKYSIKTVTMRVDDSVYDILNLQLKVKKETYCQAQSKYVTLISLRYLIIQLPVFALICNSNSFSMSSLEINTTI